MSMYPPGVTDADEHFNDTETKESYDARLRKALARKAQIVGTREDALLRNVYWLIWNHERERWWQRGKRGYTLAREGAGLYAYDDALEIVTAANIKAWDVPEESMVPATEEDLKRLV